MVKEDFIDATQKLMGSRDVWAQIFCALLRSVGVTARLVCSLQTLPVTFHTKGSPYANLLNDANEKKGKEYPIDFINPEAPRIPYWKVKPSASVVNSKQQAAKPQTTSKGLKGHPSDRRVAEPPKAPITQPKSK